MIFKILSTCELKDDELDLKTHEKIIPSFQAKDNRKKTCYF